MKKFFKFLFIKLPLAYIVFSLVLVLVFKFVPVWVTPLMVKRAVETKSLKIEKRWVPLEKVSPSICKAIIASEDNLFDKHNGFAWEEIRKVVEAHKKKGTPLRGCSTISQQTAKNVFTWCTDTWVRKGFEAYYTFLIEKIWGKKRILEVYVNVVELGKGIYGFEAASRHYYGEPAAKIGLQDAAAMAICLPNPRRRSPAWAVSHNSKKLGNIMALTKKIAYPNYVTKR